MLLVPWYICACLGPPQSGVGRRVCRAQVFGASRVEVFQPFQAIHSVVDYGGADELVWVPLVSRHISFITANILELGRRLCLVYLHKIVRCQIIVLLQPQSVHAFVRFGLHFTNDVFDVSI